MSIREYIGARYVPIFGRKGEDSIQWDNSNSYEPLTVVMYQGASYTSRQFVPAGIPITNAQYWALTGNYNAQVEQYRREVTSFNGRITENETDIDTLQAQMDGTQASALKSDIDTQASALKSDIDTLQAQMATTEPSGLLEKMSDEISSLREYAEEHGNRVVNFLGSTIQPKYVGDFKTDNQFGSCVRVDDYMYCFAPDNWTGYGIAKIFSLTGNNLINTLNIEMGHANSVCYDEVRDRFIITPLFEYNEGTHTSVPYVFSYSPSFSDKQKIYIPNISNGVYGVSFDSKTQKLYAFVATNAQHGPIYIFRMDEDETEFNLYKTVPALPEFESYGTHVWQDFAVYDDMLIAARPEGTCYCIDLREEELSVIYTFRIANQDIGGMWTYGEVEGLEFDEKGRLYNARNCPCGVTNEGAHHNANFAMVTELNTAHQTGHADSYKQTLYGTLTISDTYNQTEFCLGRSHLRSLNQLIWRTAKFGAIQVAEGSTYTDGIIRLALEGSLALRVNGTMRVEGINLNSGILFLHVGSSGRLTFDTDGQCIASPNYATVFYFRNEGTIIANNCTRMWQCTYAPSICCISTLGTLTGENANKFQDTTITARAMMMGNTVVHGN